MLELTGTIDKIEKSNISNVDLISMTTKDNQSKLTLELVKDINPFTEADPIKIIFDTNPAKGDTQKLILNGYIYSIDKSDDLNKIIISIGGLQLKIETPNEYDDFKTKKDLNIQFF